MKINRFEDIQAWQEARQLTVFIYKISSNEKFWKDFALTNQIRRSAVSVMANIVEGYGRKSKKEFHQFLNIAHASALEVQSHLYVSLDLNYISQQQFDEGYERARKTSRMIGGLMNYLKTKMLPQS